MCVHHHHYDQHMLCPHCDLLVELPTLQDGQRAVCPRCKTALSSRQREPRWRPTSFAFSALIMLLLSMLFPFVSMSVAGIRSEITLLEIPRVMVAENYASMATLFLLFSQLVPACSMAMILLLCMRAPLPDSVRRLFTRTLFQLKSWGMAEIFLAGVLVSFVKLMSYGDIGIGASFVPYIVFVCCNCWHSRVSIGAGCGMTSRRRRRCRRGWKPAAAVWIKACAPAPAAALFCPPMRSAARAAIPTAMPDGATARMDAGAAADVGAAVRACQRDADYGHRSAGS